MESPFETIAVVVNKGTVPAGIDVVIAWDVEGVGSNSISGTVIKKIRQHYPYDVYVACNPNPDLGLPKLKPDWNPPKLKKGWLTWDITGGWYWWENRPEYHAVDFWSYPGSRYVFENEEIGSVISKILGFPDCTGFDARNCIWEVGE
jgi:hypothetical protein